MTRITAAWLDDPAAQRVCAILQRAGYAAWFVGGCVRNTLLEVPVADLDIATDATPDQMLALAKAARVRAVPTGYDHGTVTFVIDGQPFEVTTFRKDVTTDGRRATVAFAQDIREDAMRRDFTMNALYADATGLVADPLGGMDDLRARRVRFIGDPQMRIKEDYLRILRFFRFTAWYGDPALGIDADGLAACAENHDGLEALSAERITAEVLRLLAAPDPAPAVASFARIGGLMRILPGADADNLAVLVHLEAEAGVEPDPLRRLAMLGGQVAAKLRLSKGEARALEAIKSEMPLPELAYRMGYGPARDAFLIECATLGQGLQPDCLSKLEKASRMVFPVAAVDLMPALSGPALGVALKQAEARWIASGFTLTKDELLG